LSGLCEKRTRIAVVVKLVVDAACHVVFLSAGQIERVLGETGRLVLTRLFRLLSAALANLVRERNEPARLRLNRPD
jgi:small neutral amino acid transporter SnatA (MarC family)